MATIKKIPLTSEQYAEASENYTGFCISCGDESSEVEPDACKYHCESCGANTVYGAEELLVRGVIEITESDE